jgi:D-glycerate 3-kinase
MDVKNGSTPPSSNLRSLGAAVAEDADGLMLEQIAAARTRCGRPVVIGLCGAQGSGKSTTADRLAAKLAVSGHATAILSIDDFYLTRLERISLAQSTHVLLGTRGVPGTHDTKLMMHTLLSLLEAGAADSVAIPRFDKSRDDRVPESQWTSHRGPIEVVLLEGWCVGARPQREEALTTPVNELEREEDADSRWRRYVNQRLESDYADLFSLLDLRILLRSPDFETVHSWRAQQEAGLNRGGESLRPMNDRELRRFIAHYERLTRWILLDEPANLILHLDSDRVPIAYCLKDFEPPMVNRPLTHSSRM